MSRIIGIDQYGEKHVLPDARIKTLLSEIGYNSAKPIFRDDKAGKRHKVGYVCTSRGYNALWIELFELKTVFNEV